MKKLIPATLLALTLSSQAFAGSISCKNNLESFTITSDEKGTTLTVKNENTSMVYALLIQLMGIEMKQPFDGMIVVKNSSSSSYRKCSERESSAGLRLSKCTFAINETSVEFVDVNNVSYAWTKGPLFHFETIQRREETTRGMRDLVTLNIDFYKYGKYTSEFAASDCK